MPARVPPIPHTSAATDKPVVRKGRNPVFIAKRNNRIIKRYYYWREIERRRRDDVIEKLSHDEFFLDGMTIRRIVRNNLDKFQQLKEAKVPLKKLDAYVFDQPS